MEYYTLILSVQEFEILKNLVKVQVIDTERNLLRTSAELSPDFYHMLQSDKRVFTELANKMAAMKPRKTEL